jgi:hypothetical protein
MRRYNIRIDGQVAPDSYSYEELLLNDVFELGDIEVKLVSDSNWTNIKAFNFPEEHGNQSLHSNGCTIDEYGQIHLKDTQESTSRVNSEEYDIDEYGQIHQQNGNNTSDNSTDTSDHSSTNTTSNGSDDNIGWKIFGTIAAIVVAIILGMNGVVSTAFAGVTCVFVCRQIWKE